MGLFDFLFRRNKHAPPPVPGKTPEAPQPAAQGAQQMAPGTQIAYSPDLIAQLKAEHQQLLNIFGMIGAAFSANDLPLTARLLDNFRHALQAHLLTENIRFYIYLKHSLINDLESSAMVHNFRQKMDVIGKAALAFLDKYQEIGTRPDFSIPFKKDLENIGKVLVDRIKREEETLYPLYFRVY